MFGVEKSCSKTKVERVVEEHKMLTEASHYITFQ